MVIYGLNFSFKMQFLRVSRNKTGNFFLVLYMIIYQSALIPRKLPCPTKFLVTCLSWEYLLYILQWLTTKYQNLSLLLPTSRKNKIKKNLILILLYIKAMFWTVKFKLSFWKLFDCVTILVDWKTPILAYQVLLSIGIIDSNSSNNKTKAP